MVAVKLREDHVGVLSSFRFVSFCMGVEGGRGGKYGASSLRSPEAKTDTLTHTHTHTPTPINGTHLRAEGDVRVEVVLRPVLRLPHVARRDVGDDHHLWLLCVVGR